MLEKLDVTKKMDKKLYKEEIESRRTELGKLQRECRELHIPVMIVFEGLDASGKGVQIGELIESLDPRGFEVHAMKKETKDEKLRPFLWRYWNRLPEKGRIAIFDTSWYRKVQTDRFEGEIKGVKLEHAFRSIRSFEQQLTADGMVLIKFFLFIDQKEQKKRMKNLEKDRETAWRVTTEDWKRNHKFEKYLAINEEMLQRTDTEDASWTLVEAMDRRYATMKIYDTVIQRLRQAVDMVKKVQCSDLEKNQTKTVTESEDVSRECGIENLVENGVRREWVLAEDNAERKAETEIQDVGSSGSKEQTELHSSVLAQADLSKSCSKEVYEKEVKRLQKKLEKLHGELYRRRIPVVLAFEGWDAGGKGGAIKRLTKRMDPRGYVVHPTCAPNDLEKKYHYLWRFWRAFPKEGHVAIFDRSWYGRVMVERIEGFCTPEEWKRAYREINEMEKDLTDSGAIVLKFWMQIDKEEQAKRFGERQTNPEKQWKITEEDWRNREKWDQYEKAVDEMILRTSTKDAPWIIVEGNSKYYARLKVIRSVIEAIEKKIDFSEK